MSERYKVGDDYIPHFITCTVVEGLVHRHEDYIYSSASFYFGKECLLEIDKIE